MKLTNFYISGVAPVRQALQLVEKNNIGMIFVTDIEGAVVGVATDGDIRRNLLNEGSLDDPIINCANPNFVWEKPTTPRELLLKRLDHRIQAIPILDDGHRLVDLVSRDHMPVQAEGAIYARARAPIRVSFGGGGSDLTHYFSDNDGGAVINTTLSLYSHATLRIRDDTKINIYSRDLRETLIAENLTLALASQGRFGLVQALLRAIKPEFGFDLFLHSDFPMNSGLGGSATLSAAVLGCFNQFRRDQWGAHEIAEIAYQAERHHLGVAGGWQDQYATVFGGFNFMEFRMDQNIVHPLRIHPDTLSELEECLILCDTKIGHDSGEIHQDQRQHMSEVGVRDLIKENVRLCYQMRNDLLRGRLLDFGQSLDQAWHLKRQFSEKITTPQLDKIYTDAKMHGAVGGKLLGAGGGGFFLFYATPFARHGLTTHLEEAGLKIRPFRFEPDGLQAWKVRDIANH